MAASLAKLYPATRLAKFFIDSEDDLATLPTLSSPGTGSLSTINGIAQGSVAFLTDDTSKFYRIRGNNTWAKVVPQGGGIDPEDYDWASESDIDNLFP